MNEVKLLFTLENPRSATVLADIPTLTVGYQSKISFYSLLASAIFFVGDESTLTLVEPSNEQDNVTVISYLAVVDSISRLQLVFIGESIRVVAQITCDGNA